MPISGLTSYGYDSTVTEVPWALMSEELGAAYGIKDESHFKLTYSGTALTMVVSAGTAQGRGVVDVLGANGNLTFASSASGSRYDTVVIRRNWTTNTTTVDIIQGTGSPVVAASRLSNPGVQDDQPIALVKVTAGSSIPAVEADLRVFPSKVLTVADLRALVDSKYGDRAIVNGISYRRIIDASSNPVWVPDQSVWTAYTPTIAATGSAMAMDAANRSGRYRKVGDVYEVEARFTWSRLGSGEGLGTGDYYFGLPVAASSWYLGGQVLGVASFVDTGVATYGECNAALVDDAGSRMYFGYHGTKVGATYPTNPPNNGDIYSFRVSYQGAS